MQSSSRRPRAATLTLLCCLLLTLSGVAGAAQNATQDADAAPNPCVGTVADPAKGMTVVSVQGFEFGKDGGKRPAKLVGVGPQGDIKWVHHNAGKYDVVWGYDVDPMANGNVFVTATVKGHETLVYELNPRTQERVWSHTFDVADTHDADLINNGTAIVVANMRNYNRSAERNDDRLFVYNRTTDEVTWEWRFDAHYDPQNLEENYTSDWTHVNDVDKIGEDLFLASPRNFDQAIVVNRSTNEIVMKLGADGKKRILDEQHNPDYLVSENGTPTVLVGDSGNDRIAEYALSGDPTDGTDGWTRTWTLKGDLNWPRDADRLPNGNTLVTDSSNHRVVEVTPKGKVVWEFYAPWLVYDAARVSVPDEHASGPTVRDLNASGTYRIHGGADLFRNETALQRCHRVLQNVSGWAEGQSPTTSGSADGTTERAIDDGTDGSDAGQNGGTDGTNGGDADSGDVTAVPGFGPVTALAALAGLLVSFAVVRRRTE